MRGILLDAAEHVDEDATRPWPADKGIHFTRRVISMISANEKEGSSRSICVLVVSCLVLRRSDSWVVQNTYRAVHVQELVQGKLAVG